MLTIYFADVRVELIKFSEVNKKTKWFISALKGKFSLYSKNNIVSLIFYSIVVSFALFFQVLKYAWKIHASFRI